MKNFLYEYSKPEEADASLQTRRQETKRFPSKMRLDTAVTYRSSKKPADFIDINQRGLQTAFNKT